MSIKAIHVSGDSCIHTVMMQNESAHRTEALSRATPLSTLACTPSDGILNCDGRIKRQGPLLAVNWLACHKHQVVQLQASRCRFILPALLIRPAFGVEADWPCRIWLLQVTSAQSTSSMYILRVKSCLVPCATSFYRAVQSSE